MKIKYKQKNSSLITLCPYKIKIPKDYFEQVINVGSIYCAKCKYWSSQNMRQHFVECLHKPLQPIKKNIYNRIQMLNNENQV